MPLDTARIQALCFDVDGTLSDTDDLYARQYAAWMRHTPFFRSPDQAARRLVMWLESPGNALMSLDDAIGLDGLVIPMIDWMARRAPKRRHDLLVVPEVPEMLANLKRRYPLAVISARDESTTMAFLKQSNLIAYFDVILTALSAPHTKPFPDPILLAAQKMGVRPQACLMIGDTTVDVRAGRAAGAQTVGVLCGFGEEGELRRAGADMIVSTTADVQALLRATP